MVTLVLDSEGHRDPPLSLNQEQGGMGVDTYSQHIAQRSRFKATSQCYDGQVSPPLLTFSFLICKCIHLTGLV